MNGSRDLFTIHIDSPSYVELKASRELLHLHLHAEVPQQAGGGVQRNRWKLVYSAWTTFPLLLHDYIMLLFHYFTLE